MVLTFAKIKTPTVERFGKKEKLFLQTQHSPRANRISGCAVVKCSYMNTILNLLKEVGN